MMTLDSENPPLYAIFCDLSQYCALRCVTSSCHVFCHVLSFLIVPRRYTYLMLCFTPCLVSCFTCLTPCLMSCFTYLMPCLACLMPCLTPLLPSFRIDVRGAASFLQSFRCRRFPSGGQADRQRCRSAGSRQAVHRVAGYSFRIRIRHRQHGRLRYERQQSRRLTGRRRYGLVSLR